MKMKLAVLIVTCSIAVGVVVPITQPIPVEKDRPVIMTTNGHGMGS
ncbi:hypothetical protein ACMX2M_27500 [Paenibacillus polymyxa]|nr:MULTISPECIES: hypothetical protein [unclassified Paenibacillus]MDQ0659935.1 hypothetical protein [Paenibacillus sp. W2I17]MDR6720223.1 hypothetical protein [Paenibacillus sp. 2003]